MCAFAGTRHAHSSQLGQHSSTSHGASSPSVWSCNHGAARSAPTHVSSCRAQGSSERIIQANTADCILRKRSDPEGGNAQSLRTCPPISPTLSRDENGSEQSMHAQPQCWVTRHRHDVNHQAPQRPRTPTSTPHTRTRASFSLRRPLFDLFDFFSSAAYFPRGRGDPTPNEHQGNRPNRSLPCQPHAQRPQPRDQMSKVGKDCNGWTAASATATPLTTLWGRSVSPALDREQYFTDNRAAC